MLLARPQVPLFSMITSAWPLPEASAYSPPAAQLPGEVHDTDLTSE